MRDRVSPKCVGPFSRIPIGKHGARPVATRSEPARQASREPHQPAPVARIEEARHRQAPARPREPVEPRSTLRSISRSSPTRPAATAASSSGCSEASRPASHLFLCVSPSCIQRSPAQLGCSRHTRRSSGSQLRVTNACSSRPATTRPISGGESRSRAARLAGGRSTPRIWSPWSGPEQCATTASWWNATTTQG